MLAACFLAQGLPQAGGTTCPAGSSGPACSACSPGSFKAVSGTHECDECRFNTFSNSTGATACFSCATGFYINTTNGTECSDCPVPSAPSLTNFGFESASTGTFVVGASGWTGGYSLTVRSGDASFGSHGAAQGLYYFALQGKTANSRQTINLQVGVTYQLQFYSKVPTGPAGLPPQEANRLSVFVQGNLVFGPQLTVSSGWATYTATFTVVAECGVEFTPAVEIMFSTTGAYDLSRVYLDNVFLTPIDNLCDCPCATGSTGIGVEGLLEGSCTACVAGTYKNSTGYGIPAQSRLFPPIQSYRIRGRIASYRVTVLSQPLPAIHCPTRLGAV